MTLTDIGNDGVIEGVNGNGDIVFTVSVDASGNVTLTQFRAVVHNDPADHDDHEQMQGHFHGVARGRGHVHLPFGFFRERMHRQLMAERLGQAEYAVDHGRGNHTRRRNEQPPADLRR